MMRIRCVRLEATPNPAALLPACLPDTFALQQNFNRAVRSFHFCCSIYYSLALLCCTLYPSSVYQMGGVLTSFVFW